MERGREGEGREGEGREGERERERERGRERERRQKKEEKKQKETDGVNNQNTKSIICSNFFYERTYPPHLISEI
jgi:hypothetical protein